LHIDTDLGVRRIKDHMVFTPKADKMPDIAVSTGRQPLSQLGNATSNIFNPAAEATTTVQPLEDQRPLTQGGATRKNIYSKRNRMVMNKHANNCNPKQESNSTQSYNYFAHRPTGKQYQ